MLGVLHYFLILCFGIHQIASFEGLEGGCLVNLNVPNYPIVTAFNSIFRYFPTRQQDVYRFTFGQQVEFHCPGNTVLLKGLDTRKSSIEGTCSNERGQANYSAIEISCKGPKNPSVSVSNKPCGLWAKLIHVSYMLKPGEFTYLYAVCFARHRREPLYTYHVIQPVFFEEQPEVSIALDSLYVDPIFDDHDPLSVQLYDIDEQRRSFNRRLGLFEDSTAYIRGSFYLTPTFLTPPEDLYYNDAQQVALRFINTVPQWKTIQFNSWKKLERQVRMSTMRLRRSVKVWSGVYGSLKVGVNKIYMKAFKHTSNVTYEYPVPSFFWKLVLTRKKAIAFFVAHNPFRRRVFEPLCKDISTDAGWLQGWDKKNVTEVFIYACTYEDLRKLVPYAPILDIENVLTLHQDDCCM